jgi:hypothetical protein
MFLALVLGVLCAPGQAAHAQPTAVLRVQTPNGFLAPQMQVYAGQTFASPSVTGGTVKVADSCGVTQTCYLPNPDVPIPVVTRYVDETHEAVQLGTDQGLAIEGTLITPAVAGDCVTAWQSVGSAVDPVDGSLQVARSAPLAAGQTDLSGVSLQPLTPGGTIMTNAQVIALGWWDDDGLDVYVGSCTTMDNLTYIGAMDGVVAYAPVSSAGGDPWYRFRSIFRGHTYLMVTRVSNGKLVVYRDLGWLAAGAHLTSFACNRLRGKLHVSVRGVARDGASKRSPVRTATC